jgi:hypothetical protein
MLALKALQSLSWLDASVPIAFMGYSYGCVLAYECARLLESVHGITCSHLICLGGPNRKKYGSWKFMDPSDCSIESFRENMMLNFGRVNPQFDMNLKYLPQVVAGFFTIFHRGLIACFKYGCIFSGGLLYILYVLTECGVIFL